ncbi:MAG: hypothetical protein JJT94_03635 [Bernardetiaceae bacterium]|nr:hypothetical protein [Bernardetiaceae bacterium]
MAKLENTFKEPTSQETEKTSSTWRLPDTDFSFDGNIVSRFLPYLIYAAFFGLIYIANRHYTDRVVRDVSRLRVEVEELRIDYTSLKSEHINATKKNKIAQRVNRIGLTEAQSPFFYISDIPHSKPSSK